MRILKVSTIAALAIAASSLSACSTSVAPNTHPQPATETPAPPTPIAEVPEEDSFAQTDPQITDAIATRLRADPESSLHGIQVDTADGVVTLSGTVATAGVRNVATFIANDITGVSGVVNKLDVDGEPDPAK